MIFPVGDDNLRNWTFPIFSYLFIAVNILIFVYEATMDPASFEQFLFARWSIPSEIMAWTDLVTLVTSMFLHGGWMHLIWNMLFLWVFWDNIEAHMGNMKFVIFYLLGGVVAALAHTLTNIGSDIPAVGASWAISAILGAYIVMFPRSKVKVLYLYQMRSFFIPAVHFLGYWIILQLISGVGALTSVSTGGWVAWRAHIWWFAFWILCGFIQKRSVSTT